MFEPLLDRGRRLVSRTAGTSEFLADSIYTRAEHAPSVQSGDGTSVPSFRNRLVSRLFGLIWLVYLVGAYPELWREDLPPLTAILAWTALIAFTLGYVVLLLVGAPLWATGDPRDQQFNRFMIGLQLVSLVTLVILLPSWQLEFIFIYSAVSGGIYLTRRDGFRVIGLATILSVLASIREGVSAGDAATAALLVGGIGMNSLFWSALMAQNRALRRARAEITRLAVAEERLRIARDLHDLLGHNLSIIALKSELAERLLPSHPDRAASEIADVQQVARTALQEVREAVAGYRVLSLVGEIDQSTHLLQAAGVLLSTRIAATAHDLPMDRDRALAWFVREGTTNIIRHASASTATLRIERHGDRVFAEYTDNGTASSGSPTQSSAGTSDRRSPGGGFGLIGLGERMRALGGEFSAGPMPERGFRLYVSLPLAANTPSSSGSPDPEPVLEASR
ncbi:MAG: sensor histidine kinase [Thermomicrobiales bacterium]